MSINAQTEGIWSWSRGKTSPVANRTYWHDPSSRAGVLCIVLCFALGIANLFSSVIAFSIVCLYVPSPFLPLQCHPTARLTYPSPITNNSASSIFLIFIEVPFLLRICPTSSKFDDIVRRFTTNYMRALIYVLLSVVQWLSLIMHASSLIAAAVFLDIAAIFYALAGMKAQDFQGSKILGGAGIAQMIVWEATKKKNKSDWWEWRWW